MKVFFICLTNLFLFSFALFAQQKSQNGTTDSLDMLKKSRVESIYRNLEYKSMAYDDIKNYWAVTDPYLKRDVLNRLVSKNAITKNGKKFNSIEEMSKALQPLYDNTVFIKCRQRYFDNEIESMEFIIEQGDKKLPEEYFDTIKDWLVIKDILGDDLYRRLKTKSYKGTDLQKDEYYVYYGYHFDINLDLLNPSVMFWSNRSSLSNYYLLSLIGKWGNDYISKPGWYFPEYISGINISYIDSISNTVRKMTYSLSCGIGLPTKGANQNNSLVRKRKLVNSGSNLYFDLRFNPNFLFGSDNFEIGLENYFNVTTKLPSAYTYTRTIDLYSLGNYTTFNIKYNNLFSIGDFGNFNLNQGLSYHTIKKLHYDAANSSAELAQKPIDIVSPFAEFEVSSIRGLLSHNISLIYNYYPRFDYGFLTAKISLMLSNNFGIDARFASIVGSSKNIPAWEYRDYYVVFSPVIRINY